MKPNFSEIKSTISACVRRASLLAIILAIPMTFGASRDDPYSDIKDKRLHDAMLLMRDVNPSPPDSYAKYETFMKKGAELHEFFSNPEASQAMLTLLDAVAVEGFGQLPEKYNLSVLNHLEAASGSGRTEFIPALKQLAHHQDPKIRKAVHRGISYGYNPYPSLELMKEIVRSALILMPNGKSESQEFSDRREEFKDSVELYCKYSTLKQRAEIQPMVEEFLTKYDLSFERFYRPRLYETLGTKSDWVRVVAKVPDEGTWEALHGKAYSRTEKLTWGLGIALATVMGLVMWLRHRHRKA
jgi:hypothetical protein